MNALAVEAGKHRGGGRAVEAFSVKEDPYLQFSPFCSLASREKDKLLEMTLPVLVCQGQTFLAIGRLLVNRELLRGFLQLDGDLQAGLPDVIVLAISFESLGDHLDSQ